MRKISIPIIVFSLFLSLSINLKFIIDKSLTNFIYNFNFLDISFIIKSLLVTVVIYFIINLLFNLIDKIRLNNKDIILNKKRLFIIFITIFTTSFIYLLVHYPTVCLNDTIFLINNPIDGMNPIIYSMFNSIVFISFKILFNKTIAIFIMSFIQVIISSIILTYIIYWFNKKINNKILTILLFCYYAFIPIISNYNMALIKDSLFALLILLLFTYIYEIVESKGKILEDKRFIFKIILISVLSSYIRRNGLILAIISLIIIFIKYGYKYKKNCFIIIILLLIFSSFDFIVLKNYNMKYFAMEKYSVPLQQVSYIVKYHYDDFSRSDYQFISHFINNPKKTISRDYKDFTVDGIKYSRDFDCDKFNKYELSFLLFWIKKYPSNSSSYVKSYLLNTYDLWSIRKLSKRQSIFTEISNKGVGDDIKIDNKVILPEFIQSKLISFYDTFNTFFNPACCFIILMISCLYAYVRKQGEVFIISLPLIVLWIILMIGAPLSSALRYMSPYLYILPIILFYSFRVTRKGDLVDKKRKSKK